MAARRSYTMTEEAARAKGGDAAAWQVIERALLLI